MRWRRLLRRRLPVAYPFVPFIPSPQDHQLEPDDWPLLGALVSKQIARAEARQERMIAKIAAAAAQAAEGQVPGAALDLVTLAGTVVLIDSERPGRHEG